jgi:hypothetical protein
MPVKWTLGYWGTITKYLNLLLPIVPDYFSNAGGKTKEGNRGTSSKKLFPADLNPVCLEAHLIEGAETATLAEFKGNAVANKSNLYHP